MDEEYYIIPNPPPLYHPGNDFGIWRYRVETYIHDVPEMEQYMYILGLLDDSALRIFINSRTPTPAPPARIWETLSSLFIPNYHVPANDLADCSKSVVSTVTFCSSSSQVNDANTTTDTGPFVSNTCNIATTNELQQSQSIAPSVLDDSIHTSLKVVTVHPVALLARPNALCVPSNSDPVIITESRSIVASISQQQLAVTTLSSSTSNKTIALLPPPSVCSPQCHPPIAQATTRDTFTADSHSRHVCAPTTESLPRYPLAQLQFGSFARPPTLPAAATPKVNATGPTSTTLKRIVPTAYPCASRPSVQMSAAGTTFSDRLKDVSGPEEFRPGPFSLKGTEDSAYSFRGMM